MIRIACIGSLKYENGRKIKETLFKLKNKFPELEIITGGRRQGAEPYIKKYALEFGLTYGEYNPAHTVYNLYSRLNPDYYNKPFKGYNNSQRNAIMSNNIDVALIFNKNEVDNDISNFIKHLDKLGKSYKIIQ